MFMLVHTVMLKLAIKLGFTFLIFTYFKLMDTIMTWSYVDAEWH